MREAIVAGETVDLSDPEDVRAAIEDAEARHAKREQALLKDNDNLRRDLEAQRQVTAMKDEKINQLDAERLRRDSLPEIELDHAQLYKMALDAQQVLGNLGYLSDAINKVMVREEPPRHLIEHAITLLTHIAEELLQVQCRFGLAVDLKRELDPHYVTNLVLAEHAHQKEFLNKQ
jgi:hypothetical protein